MRAMRHKKEPPLYVRTSLGASHLPLERNHLRVTLDLNVVERLWQYPGLKRWLQGLYSPSALMSTVALEKALSTGGCSLPDLPSVLQNMTAEMLGEYIPLAVEGPGSAADAIARLAAEAYVACAEIAWVRRTRCTKQQAHKKSVSFLEWRFSALGASPLSTSTLLCVAALGGNERASAAINLGAAPEYIRNGAFDALHLGHFAEGAARTYVHGRQGPAVFITSDKNLARAITSVTKSLSGLAAVSFDQPWLTKSQRDAVWSAAHSASRFDKENAYYFDDVRSVDAALVEVLGPAIPKNIQQLRAALSIHLKNFGTA